MKETVLRKVDVAKRLPKKEGNYSVITAYSEDIERRFFTGDSFTNYDGYRVLFWYEEVSLSELTPEVDHSDLLNPIGGHTVNELINEQNKIMPAISPVDTTLGETEIAEKWIDWAVDQTPQNVGEARFNLKMAMRGYFNDRSKLSVTGSKPLKMDHLITTCPTCGGKCQYSGDQFYCLSTPIDTTSLDKEELLKQAKDNVAKRIIRHTKYDSRGDYYCDWLECRQAFEDGLIHSGSFDQTIDNIAVEFHTLLLGEKILNKKILT